MKLTLSCVVATLLIATAAFAKVPTIADIVNPYLRIQTALANDDMKTVAADATEIATQAGQLGDGAKDVAAAASQLSTARQIEDARTAFGKLSDALVAYAKATNTPLGPDINVAYCSMVKQSWAQKGTDIKNPYYGKSMLSCGEITKEKK